MRKPGPKRQNARENQNSTGKEHETRKSTENTKRQKEKIHDPTLINPYSDKSPWMIDNVMATTRLKRRRGRAQPAPPSQTQRPGGIRID